MSKSKVESDVIGSRNWLPKLAGVPAGIGSLALIGWVADLEVLTSIRTGGTPMNPLTALALIAAGLAIILHSSGRWRLARPLFCVLIVIGLSKVLEATLGIPALDNRLFHSSMSTEVFGPGRMAPNTAVCFIVLGFAGLLHRLSHRFCIASQLLSVCVALIALFAMVGYLLGVAPLYALSPLRPMAVHTAVGIFVGAICLARLSPSGLAEILWDRGPAGSMARTVIPIAVFIPIAIGGARLWGQKAGLYGTEVGISIQVVANVTLTCALLGLAILNIYRTDRARLEREAALRRSQQFAQVGHVRWSEPDPLPIWSEEARRIHGITAGSPAPTFSQWSEFVLPKDRDGFRDYLATVRRTEQDQEWRGRITRPNGDIRQVRVHMAADVVDSTGTSFFGIISDVTELEQARRKAEHAARAKAAFLANMSHEIRTPLNGVLGFSELLMKAELDTEDHAHASLVHKSANALLHLLNDILDFSKIEAGSMDIAPEPTFLPDLFQECVSLVEPAARTKAVAIFLHVHGEVPECAIVDGLRLRQVALNLLGNAVKFTDKGFVALEVGLSAGSGKGLVIRIHDTGVGIPADRQQAIFGEFVQADPTVSRRFGGSGLGLSISRRLVELMGGTLILESEPGRGTKVELNIPVVPVSNTKSEAPAVSAPRADACAARILLVEDDELNQRLATTILHKLGHKVQLAVDGLEAVSKMRAFERGEIEFNLVFMDIQLPELDGLAATRQIRTLGPRSKSIPIVALSANAYASDVADCLDAGMDDHVPKPLSIESLKRTVHRWTQQDQNQFEPNISPDILASFEPMFLDQCKATAEMVTEFKRAMDDGSDLVEHASRVGQASHKLAGTAASFGRRELGRIAAETDACLTELASTGSFIEARACVSALGLQLAVVVDTPKSLAA